MDAALDQSKHPHNSHTPNNCRCGRETATYIEEAEGEGEVGGDHDEHIEQVPSVFEIRFA